MSVWGFGIFQNDISEDVKTEYVDLLHRNMSNEDIVQKLITDYDDADESDKECFWTALAAIQWKYGRLTDSVKEKAFDYIDIALSNALVESKRKRVLTDLKAQLNTDQPAEKKVRPYKLVKNTWKKGDVYAYKIEGHTEAMKLYEGRYFLFRKEGESVLHPGHITPIVTIKYAEENHIPESAKEFEELPFLPVRWIPVLNGDDPMSFTKHWYYQIELGIVSTRGIPQKLFYIGHFPDKSDLEMLKPPMNTCDIPLVMAQSNYEMFENRLALILNHYLKEPK